MKKIYFLLCMLAIAGSSIGQTIPNAGFETWHSYSAGSSTVVSLQEPTDWYGEDSLIINAAETILPAFLGGYTPTDLHPQVFQEGTIVHSGSSAVKIMSVKQDTLGVLLGNGFIAGSLSSAQGAINLAALTGGNPNNAITYSGGTTTNLKITSVSAWVEYLPGKDSATASGPGIDSGSLTVQAVGTYSGADTVVGSGAVNIGTTSTYTQITASLTYTVTSIPVTKVRIIFASGQLTTTLDSSTLYVDDVSMTGVSQVDTDNAVHNVAVTNGLIKVYPNPAATAIYLDGPKAAGYTCELFSVSGQSVATKTLTGSDILDVSYLPTGMYFYSISDSNGNKVQRGKVIVSR